MTRSSTHTWKRWALIHPEHGLDRVFIERATAAQLKRESDAYKSYRIVRVVVTKSAKR